MTVTLDELINGKNSAIAMKWTQFIQLLQEADVSFQKFETCTKNYNNTNRFPSSVVLRQKNALSVLQGKKNQSEVRFKTYS